MPPDTTAVFYPPEFAVSRAGYTMTVFYRNQLWVEFFQPPLLCTDLKICNIVKGGSKTLELLGQELVSILSSSTVV